MQSDATGTLLRVDEAEREPEHEPEARSPVIKTFEALMGAEPEVAQGFLLAALYVRAIRTDDHPRNVLDALFKALPGAGDWPGLRDALLTSLE